MERIFTIEEANASLVLVSPIVRDILGKIQGAMTEPKNMDPLLNRTEYHMKELAQIGVLLRDYYVGLVDFPCLRNGKLIYLCWKFGEPEIIAWHEAHLGFDQRKPVDERFYATAVV